MKNNCFVLLLICIFALSSFAQNPPPNQQTPPKGSPPPANQDTAKTTHKRLVTDLSGFELADPNKTRKERTLLGATRGGSSRLPILLAPELTQFYGAAPILSWLYPGRSDGFEIVIRDEDDNELLRQQVKGTDFRLTSAASRFKAGQTYYWSVQSFPPLLESSFSAEGAFRAVSAEQHQQIEKELAAIMTDSYADGLARADLFTRYRLWYDALGTLHDLIDRFPDRAELYERRGMIYAQIEVTKPLADADFARADELKSSTSH